MAGKFRGNVGKLSKAKVTSGTKKKRAKRSVALVKRSPKLSEEALISRLAFLTGSGSGEADSKTKAAPLLSKLKRGGKDLVGGTAPILEKKMGRAAMEVVAEGSSRRRATSSPSSSSRSDDDDDDDEEEVRDPLLSSEEEDGPEEAIPARRAAASSSCDDKYDEDASEEEALERRRRRQRPDMDEAVAIGRERVVPTTRVSDPALLRTTAEAQGLRLLHQAIKNQGHKRLLPFQQRHDYEYRLRHVATLGVVHLFQSLATARKAGAQVELDHSGKPSDPFGGDDRGKLLASEDKVRERKEVVSKEAFLAALRQPPAGKRSKQMNPPLYAATIRFFFSFVLFASKAPVRLTRLEPLVSFIRWSSCRSIRLGEEGGRYNIQQKQQLKQQQQQQQQNDKPARPAFCLLCAALQKTTITNSPCVYIYIYIYIYNSISNNQEGKTKTKSPHKWRRR
eukprot:gene8813-6198_t